MITVTQENRQQLLDKFEANVFPVTESGCWIWMACAPGFGHGHITIHGNGFERAHRVAWRLFRNPEIPAGKFVLHHCDIPQCVNPDHLYLGTQADNVRDRGARNRTYNGRRGLTHCKQGHEFTKENTRIRQNGRRECRACHREQERERQGAARAARTNCVNGHEFTEDNILIDVRGYRHCLTCKQENGRRWRESQL